MAALRAHSQSTSSVQRRAERILLVEDSPTVAMHLRMVLEGEGFTVATAGDGATGVEMVRNFRPHVVLLDYYLPDMTGEEVVSVVREFDSRVQIVLVTGRSDDNPAREMMQRLDIQGFHDKGDGTRKLMVWIESALKAHARSTLIERQADGLRRVIGAASLIHRLQPRNDLLTTALGQMAALCAPDLRPVRPLLSHGAVVRIGSDGSGVFEETLGRFQRYRTLEECDGSTREAIGLLETGDEVIRHHDRLAVPMTDPSGQLIGAFVFDLEDSADVASEYLILMARQVATALENLRLYHMATVDPVTGLMSRAHLLHRVVDWLKIVVRSGQPMSLVFIDLDRLKPVNDNLGHPAGDAVLAALGARISAAVRDVDAAGRMGGDEFMVALPSATPRIAHTIADRILAEIKSRPVHFREHVIELSASIGYGGFDVLPLRVWMQSQRSEAEWHRLAHHFIEEVDGACYDAKHDGGQRVACVKPDGDLALSLMRASRDI